MVPNLFLGLGLLPLVLTKSLRHKVAILELLMDSFKSYGHFHGSRLLYFDFRFMWVI